MLIIAFFCSFIPIFFGLLFLTVCTSCAQGLGCCCFFFSFSSFLIPLHIVEGREGSVELLLDAVVLLGQLLELALVGVSLVLQLLDLALKVLGLDIHLTKPKK